MSSVREFKRGATFLLPCVYTDDSGTPASIAGLTITCHVRRVSGDVLVGQSVVTVLDEDAGAFECEIAADVTDGWDLVRHAVDIRYLSDDGRVDYTETVFFTVVQEITRA